MKEIRVRLKENSYSIIVGDRILSRLPLYLKKLRLGQDAIVITNPVVKAIHGRALTCALKKGGFSVKVLEVKDAESSKSVQVASRLIDSIIAYAADKKPFIIAFGGGVVGDLAGFVASVTKRGIPLVQVPTTLLAQVDSSIGGKVAVDLPAGKNLVGAFYQPRLVFSDTAFLTTLSERQIKNGLAEVVKYGVIKDKVLFTFLEKNFQGLLTADPKALAFVVARSAAIKARVVEQDERETKGIRMILNFGHTVGHAIEAASGFDRYHHGEAVALGMRAACAISVRMKLMKPLEAVRIETLLSAIGLPEEIKGVTASKIFAAMKFDKKFSGKTNRFVLSRKVGDAVIKGNVPSGVILRSIKLFQ